MCIVDALYYRQAQLFWLLLLCVFVSRSSRERMSQLPLFGCGLEVANLVVTSHLLHRSWAAISDLYSATTNPNEQPSLPFSVKLKVYKQPPNYTIVAFVTTPICTKHHLQQGAADLVPSVTLKETFPDLFDFEFLCTKNNPSFSIHRGAIILFNSLCGELSLLKNQLEQLGNSESLIITGHSLGGSIASLFTLWLLENVTPSTTKRPLCITFGSPFLGDNGLQQAISQRSTWNSCFLHVASDQDPIPRLFVSPQNPHIIDLTSQTIGYKPFGTVLLCSELGYASFEDPDSILELLVAMALESAGSQDPSGGSQVINYGPILECLKRRALIRGISEWFPHPLQAGIVIQLKAIGSSRTQLQQNIDITSLIERIEKRERNFIIKKRTVFDPFKKLNKLKTNMAQLEWYKKACKASGIGYYDSYKNGRLTSDSDVEIYKNRLTKYWEGMVAEVEGKPQKEGAAFRIRWLYAGTNYRRMVEPLDIAEYYRQQGSKDYCTQKRSKHYTLLEQWQRDDGGQADQQNAKHRDKACSLTEDSCFWANVEEAIISCKVLQRGESSPEEKESSWKSLKEFEGYIMGLIKNFAVDPEIFLEQSSFMKWWKEYEKLIGSSYITPLVDYMKRKSYQGYK